MLEGEEAPDTARKAAALKIYNDMTDEEKEVAKAKWEKEINNKFGHLLPDRVFKKPKDFVAGFRVNSSNKSLLRNINHSIRLGLPQLPPSAPQGKPVCIVGGGWSLEETMEELMELAWSGCPIIALNGAGNYLLENHVKAGCLVVLDARPMNEAFVKKPIPGCRYLIASQCDKKVFKHVMDRDTYLWHVCSTDDDQDTKDVLDHFYQGHWVEIIGGSTVGMRSITLAKHMGFQQMHLFGFDSCYAPDGRHHSYEQSWNSNEKTDRGYWAMYGKKKAEGKEFRCSVWQASQAQNFMAFLQVNGEYFQLNVHGEGLLAYMLETGAKLSDESG